MSGKYFSSPSPSVYEGRAAAIDVQRASSARPTAIDVCCSRQL